MNTSFFARVNVLILTNESQRPKFRIHMGNEDEVATTWEVYCVFFSISFSFYTGFVFSTNLVSILYMFVVDSMY